MIARRGGRVHGQHDLGTGLSDEPYHLLQRVAAPHLVGERRADRVVEVDVVEVEDFAHARVRHGRALLGLAQQAERRPLLGADRVPAALAPGDGDDAGADAVILLPLAERGQAERLVVGVGADEQRVEIDRLLFR